MFHTSVLIMVNKESIENKQKLQEGHPKNFFFELKGAGLYKIVEK